MTYFVSSGTQALTESVSQSTAGAGSCQSNGRQRLESVVCQMTLNNLLSETLQEVEGSKPVSYTHLTLPTNREV